MKTILAVLLLVPIQAFSITPEQFKKSYHEIELEQAPKIEACKNQNDNVLQKSYIQLRDSDTDQYVAFEKDETKALTLMNSLDLEKLMGASYEGTYDLLIKNCNPENLKIYISIERPVYNCLENFTNEMSFMLGLIYARKNYSWSKETKEKALKILFSYLDKSLSTKRPLYQRMTAAHTMEVLVKYESTDKKHLKEIAKLKKEMEKFQESKKKYGPNICSFQKSYLQELKITDEYAAKLKKILEKIAS